MALEMRKKRRRHALWPWKRNNRHRHALWPWKCVQNAIVMHYGSGNAPNRHRHALRLWKRVEDAIVTHDGPGNAANRRRHAPRLRERVKVPMQRTMAPETRNELQNYTLQRSKRVNNPNTTRYGP
jgi:hypothetical protein